LVAAHYLGGAERTKEATDYMDALRAGIITGNCDLSIKVYL
jgi:hypothetical protein